MTSVDRVKQICKERKIPISKLEKELGFSNGYIGQLKKGVLPDDRLRAIAGYLSVSVEYLMTGKEKVNVSEYELTDTEIVAERLHKDPSLRMLFDAAKGASPEDLEFAAEMLKKMKKDSGY